MTRIPFHWTWETCEFKTQSAFRDKFAWSMTKRHKLTVISLAFVLRLLAAYFIAWTATYLYLTPYRSLDFSHYFRGFVWAWPYGEDAWAYIGITVALFIALALGFLVLLVRRLLRGDSPFPPSNRLI
jgi:hypothetical protein